MYTLQKSVLYKFVELQPKIMIIIWNKLSWRALFQHFGTQYKIIFVSFSFFFSSIHFALFLVAFTRPKFLSYPRRVVVSFCLSFLVKYSIAVAAIYCYAWLCKLFCIYSFAFCWNLIIIIGTIIRPFLGIIFIRPDYVCSCLQRFFWWPASWFSIVNGYVMLLVMLAACFTAHRILWNEIELRGN